ncbi:MAG: Gfo/Idh/MocA family oxidoreductase [Candidatus Tectomicrobia bacterium]|nr:Gfo/Idh/MocA family oxidoreductase [Candidatus Tectomicrobia bacterium]
MEAAAVGIAAIGVGYWSNVLAGALVKSPKLALRTCFTRDAAKRQSFAEKFSCDQEESYAAVLGRRDVEAVLLTTPDDTHADLAIEAAGAGKHVIVEKPMAHTLASGRAMVEACARARVTLAVAHGHRHSQAMRRLKQMLESGELGTPVTAIAKFTAPGGQDLTPRRWRYYRAACPAGPLQPLGVHLVDNLNFLFGVPQRVMAAFGKPVGRAEIDDVAHVTIIYPGNVVATLVNSFISPRTYGLHVYGTKANALFTCETILENFDETTRFRVQTMQDADARPVELPKGNILLSELEDFADAVRQGRPAACGGEEGLRTVAVLGAAARSAAAGAWVNVADL